MSVKLVGSISGPVWGTLDETAHGMSISGLEESSPDEVDHLRDGQGMPLLSAFPDGVGEFSADFRIKNTSNYLGDSLRGHSFTLAANTNFDKTYYITQTTKTKTENGWMSGRVTGFWVPTDAGYTTTTTTT